MKAEEKELLLKDLCARLPYGVKLYIKDVEKGESNVLTGVSFRSGLIETYSNEYSIEECKPYLRPLSSMTEKETDEYTETFDITNPEVDDYDIFQVRMVDWLHKHHFDVRGLIENGLALEAPKGMYEI